MKLSCDARAGVRGLGNAEDNLRSCQARMMALFQLLDNVLVALKERHPPSKKMGAPCAPAVSRGLTHPGNYKSKPYN